MLRNLAVAFMAYVLVAVGAVGRLNNWLGKELLKTFDYIPEFGLDWRVEAMAKEMAMTDNRGQLGLQTVLAALTVVIAASLAVIVVDRFDTSLGTPTSTALSESQQDVLTGFADMSSLIGPLLLVGIAVVIIGLVRRVS